MTDRSVSERVKLCAKKCCPEAVFHSDGSVDLVDGDSALKLSKEQMDTLQAKYREWINRWCQRRGDDR